MRLIPGVRLTAWSVLTVLVITACLPAAQVPTATPEPTDTPRPAATPRPTSTPTPTPTPAPLRIAVEPGAPAALGLAVDELIAAEPFRYRRAAGTGQADMLLAPQPAPELGGQAVLAERALVPVVPFPTLADDVTFGDIQRFWQGDPEALRGLGNGVRAPTLYVVTGTLQMLTTLLGPPAASAPIEAVSGDELVARVWAAQPLAWAVVPFDELEPRWKVLRVDGRSALDKRLDSAAYPLVVRWYASGPDDARQALLRYVPGAPLTNRDVRRMTTLIMTGVTAPSRHTAETMDREGVLFPARDVGALLAAADITHISNEVAFFDGCPPGGTQLGGALCGRPEYLQLLKAVGADVIELTGNHMNDFGRGPFADTLSAYREAGMLTFGGGITLTAALSPTIVTSNGNRVAFLGCNTVGPPIAWATETEPGAAPCEYETLFGWMQRIRERNLADVIVFTYQYLETADGNYYYEPLGPQITDFHRVADLGADIVSGSQAHQPQGFSFSARGSFISYGLGNLFFDQMFSLGTRQGLIERHTIYAGRHVSTELITTLLYDYAQPRVTTGDDRAALLYALFAASDWP